MYYIDCGRGVVWNYTTIIINQVTEVYIANHLFVSQIRI